MLRKVYELFRDTVMSFQYKTKVGLFNAVTVLVILKVPSIFSLRLSYVGSLIIAFV